MYEIDPAVLRTPRAEDENPSFDLGPRSPNNNGFNNNNRQKQARNTPAMELGNMDPEDIQSVIKLKPQPKQTWEPDVKAMISTKKWLSTYGLKRNRLTLDQILGSIGFKHSDDYDHSLKKPVCSRYGEGMFTKYPRKDGTVYNVNLRVSNEKIQQIENSLLQAIALYKRRIEWLTSESRRLFGVIEEQCITIVLDIKTNSPSQFGHCRNAIIRVLEEQVAQVAKFNIIRAAEDMVVFSPHGAIPVSHDSLNKAIDWLHKLDSVAATTNTSACEGIIKAFDDRKADSVYLFSEGSSANTSTELLLTKVRGGPLPVNVVAFNNSDSTTIKFLKEVGQATGGRFHAFAFNKLESDVSGTSGYNIDKKILHGGVPPGAGARDDVVKMWSELEEARNILVDIQQLCKAAPISGKSEETKAIESGDSSSLSNGSATAESKEQSEQYMSSEGWLAYRGLRSRKLDLYDVLATCSFRHCDGIVDVKMPPETDFTDAESRNKLVNAKYCDRFCHVQWKDGSVKHVHVTAEVHREYEKKMASAIDDFQRRVDWLQQGSRELFGTIIENQVYILIDVSNSMENHLGLVKEKLYRLMQEQLRHKSRFNLVRFGSRASGWRDRMLEVNEKNLQSAWQWVRGLGVSGSTNTLAALKVALSDPYTQAVYLLTDGRPDHPPKTVLAQVQLKEPIPIHTISFNCNDSEANDFLALLAHDTGGRYHYYSDNAMIEHQGPTPYESEDVRLLKEEIKKGRDDLKKLADLRVQCAMLDWGKAKNREKTGCGKDHGIKNRPKSATGFRSASRILVRDSSSPTPPRITRPLSAQARRPMSALSSTSHDHCKPMRTRTSTYPPRPSNPTRKSSTARPNVAYHSRTSYVRLHMVNDGTLFHNGFVNQGKFNAKYAEDHNKTSWLRLRGSLDGWSVPETRSMLAKQEERYVAAVKDLAELETQQKKKPKKKKVDPLSLSSKMWLKKHGLAAKNLTIYDALGKTMVKQKAKYVPILDKHVVSQVFNEIYPLAHVTGNKQEISLINPAGIDLEAYEENLEKAIELYHKRLDRIVWNGLTRDEKELFNEDDEPVSFVEYRKECIEALDRLGWPVSERNILLLEDEIEKGKRYLRHSRAIRRAVKAKYEGEKQVRSNSATPRRSLSSPSRSEANTPRTPHLVKRKSNLDSEFDKMSLSSSLGSVSKLDSASSGSTESEDEEEKKKSSDEEDRDSHHGNRSEEDDKDLNVVKGRHRTSKKTIYGNKTLSMSISPRSKTPSSRFHAGSKVIARCSEDGFYYPGTVAQIGDPRHIKIRFQSQGQEDVSSRFVIQMGGARPSPLLRTGDSVLAQVLRNREEAWLPGIVQFGPADERRAKAKFYTVVLYNYKKVSVARNGVVKIPHARYNLTVRYICGISEPQEAEEPPVPMLELQELLDEDQPDLTYPTPRTPKTNSHRTDKDKSHKKTRKDKESRKHRKQKDRDREEQFESNNDSDQSQSSSRQSESDDSIQESHKRMDKDGQKRKKDKDIKQKSGRKRKEDSESGSDESERSSGSRGSRKSSGSDKSSHSGSGSESDKTPRSERRKRKSRRSDGKQKSRDKTKGNEKKAGNDDIRTKLVELQQQMEGYQVEQTASQEKLRDELHQSIELNKELNVSRDEILQKNEQLMAEHKKLQRHHEKIERRHYRLQKRHLELKGRHDAMAEMADGSASRSKTNEDKSRPSQEPSIDAQDDNQSQAEELEMQMAETQSKANEIESQMEDVNQQIKEIDDKLSENSPRPQEEDNEDVQNRPKEENDDNIQELNKLKGNEVLALSSEDGWFYRGTVESLNEDGEFLVQDDQNNILKVPRRFVLTDDDDGAKQIKTQDTVLALHPEYAAQYGPAKVFKVLHDLWYQVGFYDNSMAEVPREEMYYVEPEMYEEVKEAILVHEDGLMNRPVVARKDNDGVYYLGTVKQRIDRGRDFIIEWPDETHCTQHWRHIFGAYSKRRTRLVAGDFVLAVADEAKMIYLPGKVTGNNGSKITVQFCNKIKSDKVDAVQSFWLAEGYYNEAEIRYKQCQKKLLGSQSTLIEDTGSQVSLKPIRNVLKKLKDKIKDSSSSSSSSSSSDGSEPENEIKDEESGSDKEGQINAGDDDKMDVDQESGQKIEVEVHRRDESDDEGGVEHEEEKKKEEDDW